jgi:peptide/nickel transport system permease protein
MTDTMTIGSLNRINKSYSRRSMFIKRFSAHKLAVTGGIVLIVVFFVAVLGPLFAGDPLSLNPSERLAPPSLDHPFGTDNYGRDTSWQEQSPVHACPCSSVL